MAKEIECFGVGNLIYKFDGIIAMSATTLNSATGEFKESDEGKTIVVNGAGLNGTPLFTTIQTWISATQVELEDDALTAVSSPAIYYYGTDDTKAFQAAIDETVAAGGGRILLGRKNYLVTDTLIFPDRTISEEQVIIIEFVGAVGPFRSHWNSYVPGDLNDGVLATTGFTIVQLANRTAGKKLMDFSWITPLSQIPCGIQVLLQNIIFRTPVNTNTTGIDLKQAYSVRVIDVNVEVADHQSILGPPVSGSVGLRLPRAGNGAQVVVSRVGIAGFETGLRHSEHADIDDLWVYRCVYGIVVDVGSHASRYGRISFAACINGICANGSGDAEVGIGHLTAQLFNTEDSLVFGNHWTAAKSHILDPANNLHGTIHHHKVVGFVGQEDGITKIGGANLVTQQIGRRLPDGGVKVATGLAQPSFTAALTSPVGESIPAETNTEQEWMLRTGVSMEVFDADGVYFDDGDGTCIARLEAPYENYSISIDVDIDSTQLRCLSGLCLKYIQGGTGPTGGTYIAATIELIPAVPLNRLRLFKVTNGTFLDLDTDTSVVFAVNNTYTLRADYDNGNIEVFVDGVSKITAALSTDDIALFGHSRQFGLYSFISEFEDDRTTQFRTFTATPI